MGNRLQTSTRSAALTMSATQRQHENTFNMEQLVHAAIISIYPLNFNKLGRIKSVHQVFILKNISHLIADYTSTANLSVNVGVRMPVNPGIDPAVGNQFSVFTCKDAVQHGTSMVSSSHCSPFFDCSICFSIIAFTCAKETGVKSLLSTPTSYCVGRSILSLGASFPVLFLLVCTCPKSCHVPLYEPP